MNKKLISILMIIGLLTLSFGGVSANQTTADAQTASNDLQSTSTDDSAVTTGAESAETQDVNASEENTTDENTTDNSTTANNTTMTPEERAKSTDTVVNGMSDMYIGEYLEFVEDIRQANTNGQYDKILDILMADFSPSEEFKAALNQLSDSDYNVLAGIFEYAHDEYQSEAAIIKSYIVLDMIDEITELNDTQTDEFTDILNYFNDGRLDNIVDLIKSNDTKAVFDFYHEVYALSDEDFDSFYDFVKMMDDNDDVEEEEIDIVAAVTSIPEKITNALTNGNANGANAQKVKVNPKVSHYKAYNDDSDDEITISISKLHIIKELLAKYFDGEITFNQLIKALQEADIDTSDLTLNEDGSLEWFGLDSVLVPDEQANAANTNSTDTTGNGTSSNDPVVDETALDDVKVFDDASQSDDSAASSEA